MKAVTRDRYGRTDVLRYTDVTTPEPKQGEVLVRIHAAAVNPVDWRHVQGDMIVVRAAMSGVFKPRYKIIGGDMAGVVESIGEGVTTFKPGDEVFADLTPDVWGAFAEYVSVPAEKLVRKPPTVDFIHAASIPIAGTSALQSLRDIGKCKTGSRVLIIGASGGVGTFAVQIAKILGAHVTGVCSTRNVDFVRDLGADEVVDYTTQDPTKLGEQFHVVLDCAKYRPLSQIMPVVADGGTYIMVGGNHYYRSAFEMLPTLVSKKKARMLFMHANTDDLQLLMQWVERGQVRTVIDRTYSLRDTAEAILYVAQGHSRGKVVITMEDG